MSNSGELGAMAIVADVTRNGSAAEVVNEWKPTVAAPCGCIPDAGIVCDTCAAMVEKNINELAEYVDSFIKNRFPADLPDNIRTIISECVLDAFHDGARWAEAQPPAAGLIITDLDASPKRSNIIISSR